MTADEQRHVEALAAAIGDVRRGGWLKPGEHLPTGEEPQTGASVIAGLAYRRHLERLGGPRRLDVDAYIAECRAARAAES